MAWSISNAMMKAYENSHCSQELAGESSAVTCSDGAPSALSNTTPMPDQFYWPDKTTEHSRLSRFGMTCEPLTESHGEDLLMWFRGDFPARTLAQQERAPDLRGSAAACGVNLQGSLARYDRQASLWKTAQCSLLADSGEYSETWPRWGMTRNGALYLLPTPALPTFESEFGLWQTPVADDSVSRAKGKWNSRGEPKLSAQAMKWPTPCASASKGSSPAALTRKTGASRANDRIDHAVMASDGGQLNPEWVEWLMGWPIGLTALKPLATGKCHCVQPLHGDCFQTFDCWRRYFSR